MGPATNGLEAHDNVGRTTSILISWEEGVGSGCCMSTFPRVLHVCLQVLVSVTHAAVHGSTSLEHGHSLTAGERWPAGRGSISRSGTGATPGSESASTKNLTLVDQEEEIPWVPKSTEFSYSLSTYLKLSVCPSIGTPYVENKIGIYTLLFLLLFLFLQKNPKQLTTHRHKPTFKT